MLPHDRCALEHTGTHLAVVCKGGGHPSEDAAGCDQASGALPCAGAQQAIIWRPTDPIAQCILSCNDAACLQPAHACAIALRQTHVAAAAG